MQAPETNNGGTDGGTIKTLDTLQVTFFATNCYVITLASGESAVIDPGGENERIVAALEKTGGKLAYILCTHGHLDHIEAAGAVRDQAGGRIVIHEEDLPLWENLEAQARLFGLPPPPALPAPDVVLSGDLASENVQLPFGPLTFEVRHVPGHSPGSVAYLLPGPGVGFNGDTVFAMGFGRVDLWGGSGPQLKASIVEQLFSLADDMLLHPGHGPAVTVAEARRILPLLGDLG